MRPVALRVRGVGPAGLPYDSPPRRPTESVSNDPHPHGSRVLGARVFGARRSRRQRRGRRRRASASAPSAEGRGADPPGAGRAAGPPGAGRGAGRACDPARARTRIRIRTGGPRVESPGRPDAAGRRPVSGRRTAAVRPGPGVRRRASADARHVGSVSPSASPAAAAAADPAPAPAAVAADPSLPTADAAGGTHASLDAIARTFDAREKSALRDVRRRRYDATLAYLRRFPSASDAEEARGALLTLAFDTEAWDPVPARADEYLRAHPTGTARDRRALRQGGRARQARLTRDARTAFEALTRTVSLKRNSKGVVIRALVVLRDLARRLRRPRRREDGVAEPEGRLPDAAPAGRQAVHEHGRRRDQIPRSGRQARPRVPAGRPRPRRSSDLARRLPRATPPASTSGPRGASPARRRCPTSSTPIGAGTTSGFDVVGIAVNEPSEGAKVREFVAEKALPWRQIHYVDGAQPDAAVVRRLRRALHDAHRTRRPRPPHRAARGRTPRGARADLRGDDPLNGRRDAIGARRPGRPVATLDRAAVRTRPGPRARAGTRRPCAPRGGASTASSRDAAARVRPARPCA